MSALFGAVEGGRPGPQVVTQLTTQEPLTFPRAEATREAYIPNASHLPAPNGPPGRGCDLQNSGNPNSGQEEGGLRGTLWPPQEADFCIESFLPPFWWPCCPWLVHPGGRPRLLIGKQGTSPRSPGAVKSLPGTVGLHSLHSHPQTHFPEREEAKIKTALHLDPSFKTQLLGTRDFTVRG